MQNLLHPDWLSNATGIRQVQLYEYLIQIHVSDLRPHFPLLLRIIKAFYHLPVRNTIVS